MTPQKPRRRPPNLMLRLAAPTSLGYEAVGVGYVLLSIPIILEAVALLWS